MKDDPTIARIRTVRHQISEQYQHDVQCIIDHYIKREKHRQGRFIELAESISSEEQMPHKSGTQEGVKTPKEQVVESC
jgi:hypothetical protein